MLANKRIIFKFLWLPKTLIDAAGRRRRRWLERAAIMQQYVQMRDFGPIHWQDREWVVVDDEVHLLWAVPRPAKFENVCTTLRRTIGSSRWLESLSPREWDMLWTGIMPWMLKAAGMRDGQTDCSGLSRQPTDCLPLWPEPCDNKE